jgi:hypothetical protein
MKIIQLLKLSLLTVMMCTLMACTRAAPDAGEAGVLVQKPWFFGHGGVVDEPVSTGLTFASWTTSVLYVSVNPQAFEIQYNDMMSSDGIPLDFHSTLTLRVTDPVSLVKNFSGGGTSDGTENKKWYLNNIQPATNNFVRDAFKSHTMHSLAIEASGTSAVEATVREQLSAYIKSHNIPVEVINYTLGRVNPPQMIKNQRIKTAEEQQRQQTELQTKIAEDNRKQAETARADADDAYRQHMSLSPEQFVELQRIDMMRKVCSEQHCTFIAGNAQALVSGK